MGFRWVFYVAAYVIGGAVYGQQYGDIPPSGKLEFFAENFLESKSDNFIFRGTFGTRYSPESSSGKLILGEEGQSRELFMYSKTSTGISNDSDWEFEMVLAYNPISYTAYRVEFSLGWELRSIREKHIFFKLYEKKSKLLFELPGSKKRPKKFSKKLRDKIHFGQVTKFTVRKTNQQYQLYVNEEFIGLLAYFPLYPNGVIHLHFKSVNMELHHIKVYKFTSTEH